MNYIKKYKNEMGGLDIDDMISNYYYFLGCWCHPR